MGKKFDLITTSKTKAYRYTMIAVAVLGVLLMGLGVIMMGMVTKAVMPNQLVVTFPALHDDVAPATAEITKDIMIRVDTGTKEKPLLKPITFTYDDNAAAMFEPIDEAYTAGMFDLKLKPGLTDGMSGEVTISCASWKKKIVFTYRA